MSFQKLSIDDKLREIIKLEEKHTKILWGLYESMETYFTCPLCQKRVPFFKDRNYTGHRNQCKYKFSIDKYDIWEDKFDKLEFFLQGDKELFLFVQNFTTNKTLIYGWRWEAHKNLGHVAYNADNSYYIPVGMDNDFYVENDFIMFHFDQKNNIKYIEDTLETCLLFS